MLQDNSMPAIEVGITIPGQGTEAETPEQLIVAAVQNFESLQRLNPRIVPRFISPNSFGIYPALVISRVTSLETAVKMANDRSQLVIKAENTRVEQELEPTGMMAILQKDIAFVTRLVKKYDLEITNYNGPLLHVVGGIKSALNHIKEEIGGNAKILAVEGVYHSRIRTPESCAYKEMLRDVFMEDPVAPMIVSTKPRIVREAQAIRDELSEQMRRSVNLNEAVALWGRMGVSAVIDIGSSPTMRNMTGRLVRSGMRVLALSDPRDREIIKAL